MIRRKRKSSRSELNTWTTQPNSLFPGGGPCNSPLLPIHQKLRQAKFWLWLDKLASWPCMLDKEPDWQAQQALKSLSTDGSRPTTSGLKRLNWTTRAKHLYFSFTHFLRILCKYKTAYLFPKTLSWIILAQCERHW